jgi:N,N'-diacetylchitobiose transport system substrate-binding protein
MVTVGGVIPNTTTLVSLSTGLPAKFAAAAKVSRFTPNSPNWANVESSNVLQDMLVSIFTGKSSIPTATSAASDKITTILNQ